MQQHSMYSGKICSAEQAKCSEVYAIVTCHEHQALTVCSALECLFYELSADDMSTSRPGTTFSLGAA